MGMKERLDVKNAAKERVRLLNFGDAVTNVCAGDGNPRRHSFFAQYTIVSTENRFGVTHTEHYAECTDKKGNFWKTDIEVIFPGHIDYEKSKELFAPIWAAYYT